MLLEKLNVKKQINELPIIYYGKETLSLMK
jgi:hypothetical protein